MARSYAIPAKRAGTVFANAMLMARALKMNREIDGGIESRTGLRPLRRAGVVPAIRNLLTTNNKIKIKTMASANSPSEKPTTMKPTLGLTGLTINAMALIAPGAFLWLTYQEQSLYGAPMAGAAMWLGLVFALLLCFATAISYAELSKLYPGAGSSYLYAEQAFLSKTHAFKWARVIKFFTGWNSHLYYWIYTGLMVGVTAILAGWLAGQIFPDTFSGTYNSPLFMWLFCIVFSLGVGYIAYRGVNGTTAVNMAINVIQISALDCLRRHGHLLSLQPSATARWAGTSPTARRSITMWHTVNVVGRQGQAGSGHLGRQHAQGG